jgi:hypothetical protein
MNRDLFLLHDSNAITRISDALALTIRAKSKQQKITRNTSMKAVPKTKPFLSYLAPTLAVFIICRTAGATPPTVTITYSQAQDAACAADRHYVIQKQWEDELTQNLPRVHDLWNMVGLRLLTTTEKITGRQFSRRDVAIHLTLCNLPSESSSSGITVNMRFALNSFTKEPVAMRYKVSVFYHELLHAFIDDYLPPHSKLLAQHESEPTRVRDHLHLLALEKAVYLELGMKEELAEIINADGQLPDGFYKRAWEIVNQDETTYLKYLDELKAHNS